jgi:hypothetical protein
MTAKNYDMNGKKFLEAHIQVVVSNQKHFQMPGSSLAEDTARSQVAEEECLDSCSSSKTARRRTTRMR